MSLCRMLYAGADEQYPPACAICDGAAWHGMFVRNMFILPQSLEEYKRFVPEFTIIAVPGFKSVQRLIIQIVKRSSF